MLTTPGRVRRLVLALAVLVLAAPAGNARSEKVEGGVLCDQQYALCTSAPCIPDPADPGKTAICDCVVHDGINFGKAGCETRQARTQAGVTLVASNYSLAEYRTKGTLTCPAGNPWTFCLDKPCTIDPMDPLRAICACEIRTTQEFVTLGGECDALTCDSAYWSGATLADVAQGEAIMVKALGLESAPDNACYLESSD